MRGQQGSATGRRRAGDGSSNQNTSYRDWVADAGVWPGVVVRESQDLCVAVIGVIEARTVIVGFVIVMRRFSTDHVPMHQRPLVVRVQVRKGQQPRERNGKSGYHRDDASGWVRRHGVQSMSARARQSQTCESGHQRVQVNIKCRDQRLVEGAKLGRGELADKRRQARLGQADQFIAVKRAVVLQSFVDAHCHLARQPMSGGIYRRTHHR